MTNRWNIWIRWDIIKKVLMLDVVEGGSFYGTYGCNVK